MARNAPAVPGDGSQYLPPAGHVSVAREPRHVEKPKPVTSRPAGKASDTINQYRQQVKGLEHRTAMI